MALLNELWSTQERKSPLTPFFKEGHRASGKGDLARQSTLPQLKEGCYSRWIPAVGGC